MEYDLVTTSDFVISGTIICLWFVTQESRRWYRQLEYRFSAETAMFNARQPRVRKAWAAIGDRERAWNHLDTKPNLGPSAGSSRAVPGAAASCSRQDWPPSWLAGSKHWGSPRQRPGPPESVPSSPRVRTSGLSTRARVDPGRTPRPLWSSRTARAASRGTALLATAARDARTRSRAISGTTHAMANMVARPAHGV